MACSSVVDRALNVFLIQIRLTNRSEEPEYISFFFFLSDLSWPMERNKDFQEFSVTQNFLNNTLHILSTTQMAFYGVKNMSQVTGI